jgi:DNA-binding NarL/FixJ family response regulator
LSVIKVIAIDDHQLYLEGIRTALERAPDIRLVATAQEGASWMQLLRRHNPDIALLDLNMPNFNATDVIRRGVEYFPGVRFVALTGSRDETLVRQIAQAGASGYLLKETILKDHFSEKIRRIYGGALLFDPDVIHALIHLHAVELNLQEQQCLSLMSQGLTNQGIADELGLSRKRVANILSNVYGKLDIDGLNEHRWVTRVVAVREGVNRGLINVSEGPDGAYR